MARFRCYCASVVRGAIAVIHNLFASDLLAMMARAYESYTSATFTVGSLKFSTPDALAQPGLCKTSFSSYLAKGSSSVYSMFFVPPSSLSFCLPALENRCKSSDKKADSLLKEKKRLEADLETMSRKTHDASGQLVLISQELLKKERSVSTQRWYDIFRTLGTPVMNSGFYNRN